MACAPLHRRSDPLLELLLGGRADLAGGTVDLWPLYLFHAGALTLNFALEILTTCRITPLAGSSIELRSLDTGREETFADLSELTDCKKPRHPLAAWTVRFFAPGRGFRLETNSESPAGAGISGSSALMIATSAALARFTGRDLDLEQLRVIAQNIENANHRTIWELNSPPLSDVQVA